MKKSHIWLIATAVIGAHALLFWLVADTNPLPKIPYVAPPNFVAKEATWTDQETGEKMVCREFKVSTKLAMPDALSLKRK